MNMIGILLSMMVMMLVVAFFFSFGGLNSGPAEDKEREKLREEITAYQQEAESLRLQAALRRQPFVSSTTPSYLPPPVTPSVDSTPPPPAEKSNDDNMALVEELQRQLAEQQEENESLEEEKTKAERKQGVAEKEASMAWKERTKIQQKQERERKRVEIASKMGTVTSVNIEYGFVVFQPASGQQFQTRQTLGIRRNSGILGQIIVKNQQGSDYIADLKPNAYAGGYPPVQEGDEIIVLPATYRAPDADDPTGGNSTGGGNNELRELLPE